jgi:hypothetical protein
MARFWSEAIGGITAHRCLRTRLTSDASQDLVYLKGAEAKRPQKIVYGEVFRRRDGPSEIQLHALPEPLQVVAANPTQRFTTTTERWGPFELVLPPGDFEVWVERGQKAVAPKRTVHGENGADVKLQLLVEYSDAKVERHSRVAAGYGQVTDTLDRINDRRWRAPLARMTRGNRRKRGGHSGMPSTAAIAHDGD